MARNVLVVHGEASATAPLAEGQVAMTGPSATEAGPDEHELIARLRSGESAALELVYDQNCRRVFGLAYRLLGDAVQAEDVVQEVFLAIWQHAGRLDSRRGQLIHLLLTVTHHKCIDRLRRRRSQAPLHHSLDLARLQARASDPGESIEALANREVVDGALAALPPAQLETVRLAYYQGYTQEEIAARMQVPVGTVKSRMRVALEHLRAVIQRREWK